MTDLEHETQVLMFNTRVLKVDPDKLDQPGYHCLRNFFETINLFEKKLKRLSSSYHSFVRLFVLRITYDSIHEYYFRSNVLAYVYNSNLNVMVQYISGQKPIITICVIRMCDNYYVTLSN